MASNDLMGQELCVVEPVFSPSLEVSVRGSSDQDILRQMVSSLTSALDSGHRSVAVFTNSRFICSALNFWCQGWISLAGDDGKWLDCNGDQVPHQALLEAVLEFQNHLEMQVFLIAPILDNLECHINFML